MSRPTTKSIVPMLSTSSAPPRMLTYMMALFTASQYMPIWA